MARRPERQQQRRQSGWLRLKRLGVVIIVNSTSWCAVCGGDDGGTLVARGGLCCVCVCVSACAHVCLCLCCWWNGDEQGKDVLGWVDFVGGLLAYRRCVTVGERQRKWWCCFFFSYLYLHLSHADVCVGHIEIARAFRSPRLFAFFPFYRMS